MTLAFTGHRPDKLGGYSEQAFDSLHEFALHILPQYKPSRVISGMALGWDQAVAIAAVDWDIPVTCAIPCFAQESLWSEKQQKLYYSIRGLVVRTGGKIVFTHEGFYEPSCMQKRNEWMVDHCDTLLALHDGSRGGTFNCIQYANKVGRPVVNLWSEYEKIKSI